MSPATRLDAARHRAASAAAGWSEWIAFTRQTWIAASSAAILVVLTIILAVAPVGFVTRTPGVAVDLLASNTVDGKQVPVTRLEGATTFPATGQLQMVTMDVAGPTSLVSLPEALMAHWTPKRDVQPRELVHAPGKDAGQIAREQRQVTAETRENAAVAGLRAANAKVTSLPVVASVTTAGPAFERLRPGDYVLKVSGKAVSKPDDVYALVASKKVNEVLSFSVLRDGQTVMANVTVAASNDEKKSPTVGAKFDTGYRHEVGVTMDLAPDLGGPSSGLVTALAVYEAATKGDLVAGRKVAAIGTIDAKGIVGPVTGVPQKLGVAEASGTEILFLPESNCPAVSGMRTKVRIVPVATLADAITALTKLSQPTTATEVPTCP